MPQNITPQYLDAQATSANLGFIKINYDETDTATGGFIVVEYRDANGNVVENETVKFSAAVLANWDGSASQALTYALSNSTRVQ